MFTGIIEDVGTIYRIVRKGKQAEFYIHTNLDLTSSKIGDSICISGACLTIVWLEGQNFLVEVSGETLNRTYFSRLKNDNRVNLERALSLSGRLDGHLVLGHVDDIGIIRDKRKEDDNLLIKVKVSEKITKYIVKKGSIAVDGISLTVNSCTRDEFSVNIISHTRKVTTLGYKESGDYVNIETDYLGKYVEKFLTDSSFYKRNLEDKAIDKDFLERYGFL
ncbi:MAG: riboflavin synthase [Thermodesulfobacteriota bacterium]|nr:riboflavin synthase [Thermodesulfobacteriota bacterium]